MWPAGWREEEPTTIAGVDPKRCVVANWRGIDGRKQVKFRRGEGGDQIMRFGSQVRDVTSPLWL